MRCVKFRESIASQMEFRLPEFRNASSAWRTIMAGDHSKTFHSPGRVNVSDVSAWISTFRDAALSGQFENCRRRAPAD